ncbi:MAG: DNA-directed RNA polymerase subunit alpha [Chloroflexota bacterium]|nr:DNA-directed RNA polymerase subunit alpha [Chloroflexota bacterium]
MTPKIECTESSENYAKFVAEPLARGLGTTLGNSLRRVLLSSLPGAAVTAVKIEGVQHEFTTIPHMKEDVIEFLLNVKALRIKPLSGRSGRLYLEFTGEGSVYASDIKKDADFEIINPELHLATLDSPDAQLDVVFHVDQGTGYVPAESGDGYPLGVIPVDAIYTPVRRVNYSVQKLRVGQASNYDQLTLEIWTDGTISPREALSQSADILVSQFMLFTELGQVVVESEGSPDSTIPAEQYEMTLEQLGLSARTFNSLRRSGITKLGELLEKTDAEMLGLRSFGQKSLDEVRERLESLNLRVRVPDEEASSEDENRDSFQGYSDDQSDVEDYWGEEDDEDGDSDSDERDLYS